MVMVAARRNHCHLKPPHNALDIKTEHTVIKLHSSGEIGDVEVNVADADCWRHRCGDVFIWF